MKRIAIIVGLLIYLVYQKGSYEEEITTLKATIETDSLQIKHCYKHHPRWNNFQYIK